MPIVPDLAICNEALAECPQDAIQSVGESSLAAAECNRSYAAVVSEILAMCDWEQQRKREAMAPVANDRTDFWPYAYALPDDLVNPLRLIPSFATYAGLYVDQYQLDGQIVTYPNWPLIYGGQFEIGAGIFYSFEPMAILEYTTSEVSKFTPLLRRAIVLELAARIVLPITKSTQRQQSLLSMSEVAKQRAMADNMNRAPRNYLPTMPSTIQQARQGWLPC